MTSGDALGSGARSILGRELSVAERERMEKYLDLLAKWQMVHRLAGSAKRSWAIENLLLDSLLFLRALPEELADNRAASVVDLGSGAGIPGIPLAVVRPQLRFALVESRQRRASFLAEVVRTLRLANCLVIAERAEVAASKLQRLADVVVARCAGDPGKIAPDARRLLAAGGVIALSGPPERRPVLAGEWVEVAGIQAETTRRFLVLRPEPT